MEDQENPIVERPEWLYARIVLLEAELERERALRENRDSILRRMAMR